MVVMTVLTRGSATKTMSTPDRFFSPLDASGFEPNQVEDEFQIWSVIMTGLSRNLSNGKKRKKFPRPSPKWIQKRKTRTRYPPDEDKSLTRSGRRSTRTSSSHCLSAFSPPEIGASSSGHDSTNKINNDGSKRDHKPFITKVQPSMIRLVASQPCRYQATLFISPSRPKKGATTKEIIIVL